MSKVIIALILTLTALAGCVSGDDDPAPTDLRGAEAFDDETGGVAGVVLDDEDRPVPGAQVALLDLGLETTASQEGRFTLRNAPVGSHTLAAQALGYDTASQRVTVEAGRTTETLLQLTPIVVVEPRHETLIFEGHITCGMGLIVTRIVTGCGTTGTPVGPVTVDPNEKNEFIQEATPEHMTIVAEVSWTPAAALAAREFDVDLYKGWVCTPFCSWDEHYGSQQGPSPVTLVAEGPFDGIDEPSDVSHIVSVPSDEDDPPFVIIVIQQDFTLYSTHFFGLPAPDGFSARPDA
jgi:hypothetical protein